MNSILITGCNRGLGLGLVKEFLKHAKPNLIFATCRNLQAAPVSSLPCEIGAIINEINTQNLKLKILSLVDDDGMNGNDYKQSSLYNPHLHTHTKELFINYVTA